MHRRLPALLVLLLFSLAGWAAPAPAPVEATAEATPIRQIVLDNGLRIFVLPRPASPTFAALYQFKVGGAFDPKGKSGIAHLLEHMLFKGTTTVGTLDHAKEAALMARLSALWGELQIELDRESDPFHEVDREKIEGLRKKIEEVTAEQKTLIIKNEYDEIMTRAGSVGMNASTSHDATTYFIQLPSNRLEFWFRMEADRLLHPVFREFYSERDVVHEERRMRYENQPGGMMYENLLSLVFQAHPYGRPNVGWPADISRLTREDAEDYFRTYYSPSNCTMVLSGDVSVEEVERLARKYFSPWVRQQVPPLVLTDEPEQKGERRRLIEFDAEPQLQLAWPTVVNGHADEPALDLLAAILGGLQSSRLDKSLVQGDGRAQRVSAGHRSSQRAGYFNVSAVTRGEATTDELEQAIEDEIARIQTDGVTADELERAKIRVETGRVRSLKSNLGQAFRVATSVRLSGGTDYIEEEERRINAVTAEQVKDVAQRYLKSQRESIVVLHKNPDLAAEGGGSDAAHKHGGSTGERGQKHSGGFDEALALIRAAGPIELNVPEVGRDVDRVKLKSGITVFIKEDHSAPSVEMSLAWLGGSNSTPVEQLAPFEIAGDLLTEGGTGELDPLALEERLDALGLNFNLYIGSTQSGGNFWSLSRNFDEAFELAAQMIQQPRLDAKRLATLKGQYIENMKRRYESPGYGSYLVQQHVLFKDHPRLGYTPTRSEIDGVTREQIRAVWKRYLGNDNLFLTVVGDFDKAEMLKKIEARFSSWRNAEDSKRKWITWKPVIRPGVYVTEKELPQPSVRIGHQIPVDRTAPPADHAAIEILNDILGGSGFRSRLMERLRSDEGLTYGIYSYIAHEGRSGVPGEVGISYQTRKDAVARSIDSVIDEFKKIVREQVSPAEVDEQIEAWRNRFVFRYTNEFYSVSRLMYNELDDRPYDFDRQELAAVQKVTPQDVKRVAKQHLTPDKLTIAIYGKLEDADRTTLNERFKLTTLPKDEIFKGGFDRAAEEPAASP